MKAAGCLLIFLFISYISSFSQEKIYGTIQDENGNPITGAIIKDKIYAFECQSESNGTFQLSIGNYGRTEYVDINIYKDGMRVLKPKMSGLYVRVSHTHREAINIVLGYTPNVYDSPKKVPANATLEGYAVQVFSYKKNEMSEKLKLKYDSLLGMRMTMHKMPGKIRYTVGDPMPESEARKLLERIKSKNISDIKAPHIVPLYMDKSKVPFFRIQVKSAKAQLTKKEISQLITRTGYAIYESDESAGNYNLFRYFIDVKFENRKKAKEVLQRIIKIKGMEKSYIVQRIYDEEQYETKRSE